MSKVAVITVAQLRRADACQEHIDIFHSLWGDGWMVSEEQAIEHADRLDWCWGFEELVVRNLTQGNSDTLYRKRRELRNEFSDLVRQLEISAITDCSPDILDAARLARRKAYDEFLGSEDEKNKLWDTHTQKLEALAVARDRAVYVARARAFVQMYIKYQGKEIEDGTDTPRVASVSTDPPVESGAIHAHPNEDVPEGSVDSGSGLVPPDGGDSGARSPDVDPGSELDPVDSGNPYVPGK